MGRGPARAIAVIGTSIGIGAAVVLVWNEWQLAWRLGALDEAGRNLVTVAPESRDDGGAVGRPLHLVGEALVPAPIRDPVLGVSVEALRLDRTVETYQWVERKEGSGDNKTLRYERIWSPLPIPSERFEQRTLHVNPKTLPLTSASSVAAGARIGRFELDEALLAALPATREILPEGEAGTLSARGMVFRRSGDWLYGSDPAAPEVGDVRVRLAAAPTGRISLIGTIDGSGRRLVPWRAPNGMEVALAAYGEVAPERLLGAAARGGWQEAWSLRGLGVLGMVAAVMFALPALAGRFAGNPAFRGRRRLGTMLLMAAGLAAGVCVAGRIGARLLLALGVADG
ncbi:TMEM43 family protein [Benzoatithermus flavus]|uniref:TMEM43 family protein n=1 Tax=Benzoatithermus flavus TaxID=3108223 RepID=A0ABU8XQV0_9PROT